MVKEFWEKVTPPPKKLLHKRKKPKRFVALPISGYLPLTSKPMLALPPAVFVRRAVESDIPGVHTVDRLAYTNGWGIGSFSKCLQDPKVDFWVVERGGQVAAFLLIACDLGIGEVKSVAVDPKVQGQGFGRTLMDKAHELFKENRVTEAFLEVRAQNHTARKLYRSYGYEIIAVRPKHYKNPDDDALVMRCPVR